MALEGRWRAFLAFLLSFAPGCLVERVALAPQPRVEPAADAASEPGESPDVGSSSPLDALAIDEVDAGRLQPDASVDDGLDAYVLAEADGRTSSEADASDASLDCGGEGAMCCEGSCRDGLACGVEGRCVARCGQLGDVCCIGAICYGTAACGADRRCAPCGGAGEICCSAMPRCVSGLGCVSEVCRSCGGLDEPCCDGGACGSSLRCQDGTCRPAPGSRGGPCRDVLTCDPGAYCDIVTGRCQPCGMRGEVCCPGSRCESGLDCRLGLSGFRCQP